VTAVSEAKQAVRERIWARLEQAGAAEPGAVGYIPDFRGAELAAGRLADLPAWQRARVVKAVPDRAQFPVRLRALQAGKLLYIAVPKMAASEPFCLLDPRSLPADLSAAADGKAAARIAPPIGVDQMRHVDLVCGSVACNFHGARLGKGAGYSDIELALLAEAGLVSEQTVIVTTVHDLQVLDEDLPEQDHDFRVDLIVTPTRVIQCGRPRRPGGIDWALLSPAQVAAIPVLARRAPRLTGGWARRACCGRRSA
jgi:5-formyltetrahydrofolate cyclo-ligase